MKQLQKILIRFAMCILYPIACMLLGITIILCGIIWMFTGVQLYKKAFSILSHFFNYLNNKTI
jgi:hypothetical protein